MRAGHLRHRLAIEQITAETRDDTGQIVKTWAAVQEVWGSVQPLKGEKRVQAQQIVPTVTHEIQIRGRSVLTSGMRILFDNRHLNINYVTDLFERGITTVAYATEVAA